MTDFFIEEYDELTARYSQYITISNQIYTLKSTDVNSLYERMENYIQQKDVDAVVFIDMMYDAYERNMRNREAYCLLYQKLIQNFNITGKDPPFLQPNTTDDELTKIFLSDDVESLGIYIIQNHISDLDDLLQSAAYYGSLKCFRYLTSNGAQITRFCSDLSFAGRNNDIIIECVSAVEPTAQTLDDAVWSHCIDYAINLKIQYKYKCYNYHYNLEFFLYTFVLYKHAKRTEISMPDATKFGISSLIEYLHDKEHIIQKDFYGQNALNMAARHNLFLTMRKIIELGEDINSSDNAGNTALHYTIRENANESALELINLGANINSQNNDGSTPLIEALRAKNKTMFKALLNKKCDVEKKTKYGKTALFIACESNYLEEAKELVKAGANVNCQTKNKETPLMAAALRNFTDVMQFLIENGADVNAQKKNQESVLMWACKDSCAEAIKLLIANGADITLQDKNGRRAVDYCEEESLKQLLK